jgi:hypothetical protein
MLDDMNDARDFTNRLADLLGREHSALAEFLWALSDFDRRRLWLELGYRSLFEFLHRELALSKSAAHFRKVAAELVGRFPEIVEPLRDGRLCITSVVELAKVISPENCAEVLPRFFHRSKREAMEVVAELRPAESVPTRSVVTPVRVAPSPSAAALGPELALVAPAAPVRPAEHLDANSAPAPQRSRDGATPLTAELSRFHITVSRRFLAKIAAARDALELRNAFMDRFARRRQPRSAVSPEP